jgi:Zn-dependent alcohol dehydrogenase
MKMQAAVLFEQGLPAPYIESKPFQVEEVELAAIGEDEVLVEVRAGGLCHSDLSIVAGYRKRPLPFVGGHEGAGIVREIGRMVKALKPGDHVVMTSSAGCGHCHRCVESRPVLCETIGASRAKGVLPNGQGKLSLNGRPLAHYSGISSFAQYAVAVPSALIKVDKAVPIDVAAMFGCAVVTGVGAVLNAAKVRPGETVAIFGLGGVGLNAVMGARLAGASRIVGIDINEDKFALALELGCTDTISARDPDIVTKIKDLTNGGVDHSFEVSGAKSAATTADSITRKGGEIICVGVPETGVLYDFPAARLVMEERVIRGAMMGSGVASHDIPLYIKFFLEGRLPVDKLKSGTFKLEEMNQNLDALDRGAVLRQILLPHG